jgi:hypothetical protein
VPRQHWSCALAIISTAVPEVPAARQDRQTRRQGTQSTTWYVRIAPVSSHGLKSSYTATVVLSHASAALLTGVVHVQCTSSCAGPGSSCGNVKGKAVRLHTPSPTPTARSCARPSLQSTSNPNFNLWLLYREGSPCSCTGIASSAHEVQRASAAAHAQELGSSVAVSEVSDAGLSGSRIFVLCCGLARSSALC